MCGEKHWAFHRTSLHLGSPPHVRGKGQDFVAVDSRLGITPACAGKSHSSLWITQVVKDHPRMCGEKLLGRPVSSREEGSPPHVRGKVSIKRDNAVLFRITPACAGKSLKRSRSTVPPVAIVPLFPSVCNKPVVSDGSPAGRDAPLFLPAENAVPASPAYNLRSL